MWISSRVIGFIQTRRMEGRFNNFFLVWLKSANHVSLCGTSSRDHYCKRKSVYIIMLGNRGGFSSHSVLKRYSKRCKMCSCIERSPPFWNKLSTGNPLFDPIIGLKRLVVLIFILTKTQRMTWILFLTKWEQARYPSCGKNRIEGFHVITKITFSGLGLCRFLFINSTSRSQL